MEIYKSTNKSKAEKVWIVTVMSNMWPQTTTLSSVWYFHAQLQIIIIIKNINLTFLFGSDPYGIDNRGCENCSEDKRDQKSFGPHCWSPWFEQTFNLLKSFVSSVLIYLRDYFEGAPRRALDFALQVRSLRAASTHCTDGVRDFFDSCGLRATLAHHHDEVMVTVACWYTTTTWDTWGQRAKTIRY